MKLLYVKLTNFSSVKAAMGLDTIELDFSQTDKSIIQLYGKNRCGKTVIIQQLHPYSSINLSGDERNELSLIRPGMLGEKVVVYNVNDKLYKITHTYKPTAKSHSVSSSILCDGEELNSNGSVTACNYTIEKIFGINKYVIQFIFNGTQLTSIANMSDTQRKTLINKAMGIDIYDKINKLSTDDYRYTNKIITSLNQSKEFILSKYGSHESLQTILNEKETEKKELELSVKNIENKLNTLKGTINTLKSQNIESELSDIEFKLNQYNTIVQEYGCYEDNAYENLINEQIEMNSSKEKLKSDRSACMKDLDILYSKRNKINENNSYIERSKKEYDELIALKDNIIKQLNDVEESIDFIPCASSSYYVNLNSVAQAINGMCKELYTTLNEKHLNDICDILMNGGNISNYVMSETSKLNNIDKNKLFLSQMRNIISNVDGIVPDDCIHDKCIYKLSYNLVNNYFDSVITHNNDGASTEDIDALNNGYRNIQSIIRLINIDMSEDMKDIFSIQNIAYHIKNHEFGIDVKQIHSFIEEASKCETKTSLVERLSSVNKNLEAIERVKDITIDASSVSDIELEIQKIKDNITDIDNQLNCISIDITNIDTKRAKLSQIKNINISDLLSRQHKLQELVSKLNNALVDYNTANEIYNNLYYQLNSATTELENIKKDYNQYSTIINDIESYSENNIKYKIISEATSSTKGKPVLAIKDTIDHALNMTNKLLDVMYDGEIRMLSPIIDETQLSLPFRVGCNTSPDIRYGSQSESTLLSLALSLSLSSALTSYNVPLIDEIDAYLDSAFRDNFLMMLQEIMSTLNMEQMFIISHSILPSNYEHVIHEINLSEEIQKQSV